MTRQRQELQDVCKRLERDYGERFIAAGATGYASWANNANIGFEARFGKTIGPMLAPVAHYARRHGWHGWFGPLVPFRTVEDAERELRQEIETYLAKLHAGYKPRMFGD
jgi:hypothetical protein